MRHWSASYLGIPHAAHGDTLDGVDCWGLVRLVYREQLGVDVPAYAGAVSDQEVAELGGDWPWCQIEAARANEFDLITVRYAKVEAHVGIVAGRGLMLHAGEGITSRLDRIGAEHWRAAIGRYLRHRDLA